MGGLLGGVGVSGVIRDIRGVLAASRECRYSGARRGIGGIRGHWGFLEGVGAVRGVRGCRGALGWQVDWKPKYIGPPVQGPITPTGFPWGVTYLAKAKQMTEMSSAGYYIHLELYSMTVCTFVSMPPHHIFLHAM